MKRTIKRTDGAPKKSVKATPKQPLRKVNLKVVDKVVASLVKYAKNAKLHSKKQIAQIAESIVEFGFNNPVLIDPNGGIIAGHGRVLAAKKLGMKTVPCIVLGHLTEKQKQAYILADNRLSETGGGWDKDVGLAELENLSVGSALLQSMFEEFKDDLESLPGVGNADGTVSTPTIIEEMELQPEEHYDFIVVMASQVNEWNRLCALFGVKDVHSTRTSKRIGIGRAVHARTVLNLIEKKGKTK